MSTADHGKFYTKLEVLGESEVRPLLASGAVYGGDQAGLVKGWLRRKDQERTDALSSEHLEIACADMVASRDAADAARDAVREANAANKLARGSIAISAIVAIISLVAIFRS